MTSFVSANWAVFNPIGWKTRCAMHSSNRLPEILSIAIRNRRNPVLVVSRFLAGFEGQRLLTKFLDCIRRRECDWQVVDALIKIGKAAGMAESLQDRDVTPGCWKSGHVCADPVVKLELTLLDRCKNRGSRKELGYGRDCEHVLHLHRHVEFDVCKSIRSFRHDLAVFQDYCDSSLNLLSTHLAPDIII